MAAITLKSEAQSSPLEPTQNEAGIVTTSGQGKFSMREDTILTFTHGFSVSPGKTSSKWFRHTLATDGRWWQILVETHEDSVRFCYKCMSDGKSVPCFTRAFSYVITKKHHGLLAKGQVPWFGAAVGTSSEWTVLAGQVLCCIPDDKTFFVSVSLSVINDKEIVKVLHRGPVRPQSTSHVLDKTLLERLWNSKKSKDLVVETSDGSEIKAHRCVLIENSPVFAAMFANDTLEKASGRLKLDDLAHDVVDQMLRFFYLEEVSSEDTEVLLELVQVADRYDVPALKKTCESLLLKQLSSDHKLGMTFLPFAEVFALKALKDDSEAALMACAFESFVPCLHLAADHSAELLLRHAAALLCLLRSDVTEDPDWKKFEESHGEIAKQLLKEFMDAKFSDRMCAEVREEQTVSKVAQRVGKPLPSRTQGARSQLLRTDTLDFDYY